MCIYIYIYLFKYKRIYDIRVEQTTYQQVQELFNQQYVVEIINDETSTITPADRLSSVHSGQVMMFDFHVTLLATKPGLECPFDHIQH